MTLKRFLLMLPALGCSLAALAQQPLFRDAYTADPAPMVASDGRLYVFCGHDEQFDDKPGYEGQYGFNITEWLCYSTADMKTWTSHGAVMKPTDFSWAVGEAWASQCIEAGGKYYFYVSCQSGEPYCKAIGVAVADRPEGPYRDAIGKALILDGMTPNGERGWWNDFDPTVMIDDDGTPWLCWGNGTCFLARLKRNMVELDGDIKVLPMENYVEGPWIYKRGGWYYNVYASMGAGRETISYAMAPAMEGPWTFKGELCGMAKDSFTIHPGVIEYKGHNYLFYHNSTLSLEGYGPATGRRSVCVDELFYNPDGTMQHVKQTGYGLVDAHPALAPYFTDPAPGPLAPSADGFIRRWTLLEPILKPNRSNTMFTDSYVREAFYTELFPGQLTCLPREGDRVLVGGQPLFWHALDSKLFNVKLFRYATGLEKERYGLIFWAVTQIDCPQPLENVRLSAGSNAASLWWVDGEEVLLLSNDRRMVADDGASRRLNLSAGRHVIRAAVINGPGMSDFCVRFVDAAGQPVTRFTILNQ